MTTTTVLTHGILHGQDIHADARSARAIAADAAASPRSVSMAAVAREEISRARARVARKGPQAVSKLRRTASAMGGVEAFLKVARVDEETEGWVRAHLG